MRSRLLLATAALAIVASPLLAQEGTLVASGTGTVQLTPDRATVSVAIENAAAEASTAGARNAETVAEVRAALEATGIAAAAITTAHYNVRANWRRQDGERVRDGYAAETVLSVMLEEVEQAGNAIDTALRAGATRIDGVQFTSSLAADARHEAIALAVREAMAVAEVMAMAAGGQLGTLVELSTEGAPRPVARRAMAAEMMVADAPTTITPGELTITVRVAGRWRYEKS